MRVSGSCCEWYCSVSFSGLNIDKLISHNSHTIQVNHISTLMHYFGIKQRLNFTILRWILDNLIALIFIGNKVDFDLGVIPQIKQIYFEKYPEVRGRVISFNMAVRFDRSVELVLSSEDINILYSEVYLEYSKRPVKYKVLAELKYFDIQNNEIIVSKI